MKSEQELKLLSYLSEVSDPEIPVINIVEMGIVRDVSISEKKVTVTITPTYSGCPALHEIKNLIALKLADKGYEPQVEVSFKETWTTDWLTSEAREKLREYGIAPPGSATNDSLVIFPKSYSTIACPFCRSSSTEKRSEFGSTACKALYFCNGCSQPFEYFKAI
jgi:ring-1,2-phenylacetyl-CoA epoxidase subunit PaaD